ncbi:transposase zinc-binding domain-containing protein, partial [Sinorhizobium sp. 7-81]|uniref:transposase zinc-binding domain-containing protein n=1 Tax=Sinorhizobium sp. 8-89 TaxID=3049089 RepID=UPI0024C2B741
MRPALEVAEIFRRHGSAYTQAHAGHLGRVERRVMAAIELCRTAALGGHVETCEDCNLSRVAYNSRATSLNPPDSQIGLAVIPCLRREGHDGQITSDCVARPSHCL